MGGVVFSRARTVEVFLKAHALEDQVVLRAPGAIPRVSGQNFGVWSRHTCFSQDLCKLCALMDQTVTACWESSA